MAMEDIVIPLTWWTCPNMPCCVSNNTKNEHQKKRPFILERTLHFLRARVSLCCLGWLWSPDSTDIYHFTYTLNKVESIQKPIIYLSKNSMKVCKEGLNESKFFLTGTRHNPQHCNESHLILSTSFWRPPKCVVALVPKKHNLHFKTKRRL
jgi:hypothetical protein